VSYSLCPWCGGMLEGYDGSPCTNPTCVNGRANRAGETRAPLTGQVSTGFDRTVAEQRARKSRRRAQRLARRANRGPA
jgi:hypothetical protein